MSLTALQIERQDIVDSAIFDLLEELSPRRIPLEWNIEEISRIRETIQEVLSEHGITEMEFYPYKEIKQ